MNFATLPEAWPTERSTLQHIATHVLAQARRRHDGLFDLVPDVGGFATPAVGPGREVVRLAGGSLFVERAVGANLSSLQATTVAMPIAGSTVGELCSFVGFTPDPAFSAGPDTPPLGDTDAVIALDAAASSVLGDWFLLGRRVIDAVVASLPDPAATIGRLWPEHFDYGIDLAAAPDVRCNLGAAAGDGFHEEPYLYVGPWDAGRPGPSEYWNAPFGAVLGFGDLDAATDPLGAATEFMLSGIGYLRAAE